MLYLDCIYIQMCVQCYAACITVGPLPLQLLQPWAVHFEQGFACPALAKSKQMLQHIMNGDISRHIAFWHMRKVLAHGRCLVIACILYCSAQQWLSTYFCPQSMCTLHQYSTLVARLEILCCKLNMLCVVLFRSA